MKRKWPRMLIVAFWLATTFWLVRYEAFPGAFTNSTNGYRSLLGEGVLAKDAWMKIMFQDSAIGYTHTRLDLDESARDRYCTVYNQTVLKMKIMGEPQKVGVNVTASLDNSYQLLAFSFSLSSRGYAMHLDGKRAQGDAFDVTLDTGHIKQKLKLDIPKDAVLYSPMTEMAMKHLKPGQEMTIKAFDPTTMSTLNVPIKALRVETLTRSNRQENVTVLSVRYSGMDILSWINADGVVLRQETPIGWTMVACEPEEAMAVESSGGGPADILTAMSVPVTGAVSKPRECRKLRLRRVGGRVANLGLGALGAGRQTVERATEGETVLTVVAQPFPPPAGVPPTGEPVDKRGSDGAARLRLAEVLALPNVTGLREGEAPAEPVRHERPSPTASADVSPYLAATPYIQSDNPKLRKQAREIVATATNQIDAAAAIYRWVYTHVRKNPTVSVPSALDVLDQLEGDCNEHTYLFVGLARAAGLPAKVMVGITYSQHAFYYHAWPAVYAGGTWIEMDPTLGEPGVDATHIALLEGELRDQLKLMQVVGQLRAEILSEENKP